MHRKGVSEITQPATATRAQLHERFVAAFKAATDGVPQHEVAAMLDVDAGHISRILRNGAMPGRKTARRMVARYPQLRDVLAALYLDPVADHYPASGE